MAAQGCHQLGRPLVVGVMVLDPRCHGGADGAEAIGVEARLLQQGPQALEISEAEVVLTLLQVGWHIGDLSAVHQLTGAAEAGLEQPRAGRAGEGVVAGTGEITADHHGAEAAAGPAAELGDRDRRTEGEAGGQTTLAGCGLHHRIGHQMQIQLRGEVGVADQGGEQALAVRPGGAGEEGQPGGRRQGGVEQEGGVRRQRQVMRLWIGLNTAAVVAEDAVEPGRLGAVLTALIGIFGEPHRPPCKRLLQQRRRDAVQFLTAVNEQGLPGRITANLGQILRCEHHQLEIAAALQGPNQGLKNVAIGIGGLGIERKQFHSVPAPRDERRQRITAASHAGGSSRRGRRNSSSTTT